MRFIELDNGDIIPTNKIERIRWSAGPGGSDVYFVEITGSGVYSRVSAHNVQIALDIGRIIPAAPGIVALVATAVQDDDGRWLYSMGETHVIAWRLEDVSPNGRAVLVPCICEETMSGEAIGVLLPDGRVTSIFDGTFPNRDAFFSDFKEWHEKHTPCESSASDQERAP